MNLNTFSAQNMLRAMEWHQKTEWNLNAWMVAALGELGEAANLLKKMNRLQDGLPGNSEEDQDLEDLQRRFREELADTVTYLDLLMTVSGGNLSDELAEKFNAVSLKHGLPQLITPIDRMDYR